MIQEMARGQMGRDGLEERGHSRDSKREQKGKEVLPECLSTKAVLCKC